MMRTALIASRVALVGVLTAIPFRAVADEAKPAPATAAPAPAEPTAPEPASAKPAVAPATTAKPASTAPDASADGLPRLAPRGITGSSWRQSIRATEGQSSYPWFEAEHVVFELRFGPYYAEVDEEFSDTGAKPFATYFGDDARVYFGMELDWVPLHLRYVGSFGLGVGWGYTRFGGYSFATSSDADGLGAATEAETGLNIFPMHASVVARFDGLLRELGVPIVPYIKGGFGMGYWNAVGSDGTSESVEGGATVVGEGMSYGTHLAIGAALALNAFDPVAASTMRSQTGLNYAYFFGEWMRADLDGIGDNPQMHIGDKTMVFGLALDW